MTRAIGHVRYSTAGESKLANAQPLVFKYRDGDLAIATNGNIVNAPTFVKRAGETGFDFPNDKRYRGYCASHCSFRAKDIVDAVKDALQRIIGGFAFLIHDE